MTEEEKKAIKIVKGLAVYYDDYSLLDEEEIEENESVNKSIELILNLIEKLLKENEKLKKDYYNVINKIENKIDILDIVISECIYIDDDDKAYKKAVEKDKLCLLNQKRALQELLDGSDTDVGSIGSEN